jgi:hypothetical protein
MMRIALIALAATGAVACTIDGPEPGSVGTAAELERQERIRRETEQREQLCRMIDRNSDRYEAECARNGDRR